MRLKHYIGLAGMSMFLIAACQSKPHANVSFIDGQVKHIIEQHTRQTDSIEMSGRFLNPRTVEKGKIVYVPMDDWTSGFFPGSMWLDYDLTKDVKWKSLAEKYCAAIDSVKYLTWHHDVGFMIGCSYLTGYRLIPNEAYKNVIITAARSLSTRFRPTAHVIQSWNTDRGWQAKRGWECPVIIDNMMNLELLFEATRLSGDSTFHKIAVQHADATLKNHFRPNSSCYHVVDYSLKDGSVRKKQTAQGYSDESAWARGQAWAIYGFTTCYRYTHDERYLEQAEKTLQFVWTNKNLPKDKIPYWDFDAPNIPNEPRDASAAACIASALYEMAKYRPEKNYKEMADKILESLADPDYLAQPGTNGNFILKHSVGSIPHGVEIDVPLNYADYYYQEAIIRKRDTEEGKKFTFETEQNHK